MPKFYGSKSQGGVGLASDGADLAVKSMEKQRFIEWYSTPDALKVPRLQKELAVELGVTPQTISAWKRDPRVMSAVRGITQGEIVESLGEIVDSMKTIATDPTHKSSVAAARLLLDMLDKGEQMVDTVPLGDLSDKELKELVAGVYDAIDDRAAKQA